MSIVFVARRMQKPSYFIMVILCLDLTTQSQYRECFSLGWNLRHSKEHIVLLSDEVDWKKDFFFLNNYYYYLEYTYHFWDISAYR